MGGPQLVWACMQSFAKVFCGCWDLYWGLNTQGWTTSKVRYSPCPEQLNSRTWLAIHTFHLLDMSLFQITCSQSFFKISSLAYLWKGIISCQRIDALWNIFGMTTLWEVTCFFHTLCFVIELSHYRSGYQGHHAQLMGKDVSESSYDHKA